MPTGKVWLHLVAVVEGAWKLLLPAQLILEPVLRRSVLVLMQLMLVKPSLRPIKASHF